MNTRPFFKTKVSIAPVLLQGLTTVAAVVSVYPVLLTDLTTHFIYFP